MIQQKINIHNTAELRRVLIADSDIGELKNRSEGSVSEDELKQVLHRYNIRDGLITIGKTSNYIFNAKDANKISRSGYRDPETGIFITQFALAYLANILISSGSNDHKAKQISNKENLLTLCNIYSNCLEFPEIKDGNGLDKEKVVSLFVRMYGEQMEFQFDGVLLIARSILIFSEIAPEIVPDKIISFSDALEKETGLNMTDYFQLSMAVWASGSVKVAFSKEYMTNANIPSMANLLSDKKVSAFLDMIAADYVKFKSEDERINSGLLPVYTKTRFNPLNLFPIIKTKREDNTPYVMPNTIAYVKKAFGGIYWWLHLYYEKNQQQQGFRNYFGRVFEVYVGKILESVYGKGSANPEITYGKENKKFVDWWVERDGKIYLFESKAYQFALTTKQTGDYELLVREIKTKIADSIEQVFKRIADIDRYDELKHFRGKELIPVIIFFEIPLVSSGIYNDIVREEIEKIEKEKNLSGLNEFKIKFLNIEELELYADAVDKISLEKAFSEYENNKSDGFLSVIQRAKGGSLRNSYLYRLYDGYWKEMIKPEQKVQQQDIPK